MRLPLKAADEDEKGGRGGWEAAASRATAKQELGAEAARLKKKQLDEELTRLLERDGRFVQLPASPASQLCHLVYWPFTGWIREINPEALQAHCCNLSSQQLLIF